MTDYNDGKWHGWSGGECPVEVSPMSEVRWKNADGHEGETIAGPLNWTGHRGSPVIAFRVTKPAPPKPRERYLRLNHNGEIRECDESAEGASLWREVLPSTN